MLLTSPLLLTFLMKPASLLLNDILAVVGDLLLLASRLLLASLLLLSSWLVLSFPSTGVSSLQVSRLLLASQLLLKSLLLLSSLLLPTSLLCCYHLSF
jgi:hypothetical protein